MSFNCQSGRTDLFSRCGDIANDFYLVPRTCLIQSVLTAALRLAIGMPSSQHPISLLIVYPGLADQGEVALFAVQNCPGPGTLFPGVLELVAEGTDGKGPGRCDFKPSLLYRLSRG